MTAERKILVREVLDENDLRFRFAAHREGRDYRHNIGYGATEAEARDDLARLEREQYESEHPEDDE